MGNCALFNGLLYNRAMKIDARKLAPAALEHTRLLVVAAVNNGMKRMEASKTYMVSLRAVNKWVALARHGGSAALKLHRRGRPAGRLRLTAAQVTHIQGMLRSEAAAGQRLTRTVVMRLIKQEYGVEVSVSTAGRYLRVWRTD